MMRLKIKQYNDIEAPVYYCIHHSRDEMYTDLYQGQIKTLQFMEEIRK